MKFYAEPNLYVRFTERHRKMFGVCGFKFNDKGEFDTNNPFWIRLLCQQFKHEEQETTVEQNEEEITAESSEDIDEPKLRHCKKCEFTCETQGELLKHYREVHPKQ